MFDNKQKGLLNKLKIQANARRKVNQGIHFLKTAPNFLENASDEATAFIGGKLYRKFKISLFFEKRRFCGKPFSFFESYS